MALFSDQIGLRQPGAEIGVDLTLLTEAKNVDVVAGRNGLDPAKARMLQPPGEDNMSIQPLLSRCHLREGHPDLKRDPGLFGQNPHRADRLQRGDDVVIERSNLPRFVAKMIGQLMTAAGVRLIAVRECTSAFWAAPQCGSQGRSSRAWRSINPG